jgi:hypothetical protein
LLDPVEEAFNDIAGPVELWAETGPSPASLRVRGLAELAGADHTPYVGDSDALLDGIEEFLTDSSGAEPDRTLATILFTDVVDSTKQAASEMG